MSDKIDKDILESTLTQVEEDNTVAQYNLEPERMELDSPFSWKNQLYMHDVWKVVWLEQIKTSCLISLHTKQ